MCKWVGAKMFFCVPRDGKVSSLDLPQAVKRVSHGSSVLGSLECVVTGKKIV